MNRWKLAGWLALALVLASGAYSTATAPVATIAAERAALID